MRKFGLFLCLSLLFAFTGCSDSDDVEEQGGTTLAKPSVAITTTTSSSFKVTWDAVPNAEGYKYQLSQESEAGEEHLVQPETATSATSLSFSDLEPKTKYVLRVKSTAAAGSGMSDSPYAKVFATTLSEEQPELTFDKIAVSEITYESVTVEIVPAAENLYYWQVVENSLVEGKSDRDVVAALKSNIAELASGTVKKTVHGLEAETKYTVVAFGYDLDAQKATSAVARLETPFTTSTDTRMSIAITVGTPTSENVHVAFAPSTANADYFADVVSAADIEGKTDMEIVSLLQAKYGNAMTDIARKGNYEGDFSIQAGKDYAAVAFAYDTAASELTSKLASKSFSAPLAEGSSIFSITLSNPTDSSFDYAVTSNDPDMYYTEMAIPVSMLPSFNEAQEIAGLISEINELCAEYGFDFVAEKALDKGNVAHTFPNLNSETEYKLFVIGLAKVSNEEVKACTTFARSEGSVTTLEAAAAKDGPWADMTPTYEKNSGGTYSVFVDFTPNDKAATIRAGGWSYTGSGDPTSLADFNITESALRDLTIGDSGIDVNMSQGYIGVKADTPGQVWLFSSVAKSSTGQTGKVNWIIVKVPATTSGELTILGQHAENEPSGGGTIELVNAGYSDYIGNWTLTSSASMVISGNQVSSSSDPVTHHLKIEENVKDKSYKVYGWSADVDFANANPFVMNYDATETEGVSGWITIPLSQKLLTEGNIDWTLCARFIGGNSSGGKSYYFYSNTNMTEAFFGATESSGAVLIMGNSYGFDAPIGDVDIQAMSFVGIDSTNPNADVQLRPLENKHAVAPYILIKEGSSAATSSVERMRIARKATDISRIATIHQEFARLSTASAIGDTFANLMKRNAPRELTPMPVGSLKVTTGYDNGIRAYFQVK